MIDESAIQLSRALEAVSTAVARWTVDQHVEVDPTLPERYGERWRQTWVADVSERLAQLAQAVAVRRSEVFDIAVCWWGTAFRSREIRAEDLTRSLTCMRDVLAANLPESVNGPILRYVERAIALDVELMAPEPFIGLDRPLGRLTLQYLEAVLERNRRRSEEIIVGAAEAGTPVAEIYLDVFQPALAETGRMWHLNEIGVADEHFAVSVTESLMGRLQSYVDRKPCQGRRVVVLAIAGELHALGPRMVADFFDMAGWDTVCLGANMPTEDIIRCLREEETHLLAASVTSTLHLRTLGELVRAIRSLDDLASVRVIVGGRPIEMIPDLWKGLGADGSARTAPEAVAIGDRLVSL